MDNPAYVALTRQSGLAKAMQLVANNIANMSTTGYRREGTVFAETLRNLPVEGGTLAMTDARVRMTSTLQASIAQTGGTFDFALEGPGFFQVETIDGVRLTRSGAFSRSEEGELVTLSGDRVLDEGGAPVFLPPDAAKVSVGPDGTIDADGTPLGRLGIVEVANLSTLTREGGLLFVPAEDPLPAETTRVLQGALEGSNVNAVAEMTRMIEIQRAYEMGAKFLDREDERIRGVIRTFGSQT